MQWKSYESDHDSNIHSVFFCVHKCEKVIYFPYLETSVFLVQLRLNRKPDLYIENE